MTITVCKDCQGRYPACWGSCPKYLEARAEHEKKKAEKRTAHHMECAIRSVQYTGLRRQREWTVK